MLRRLARPLGVSSAPSLLAASWSSLRRSCDVDENDARRELTFIISSSSMTRMKKSVHPTNALAAVRWTHSSATATAAGAATTASAASSASPFISVKDSMSRSYKLSAVLENTNHGVVLGKQENTSTYSFVGFEGVPFLKVAECVMQVPVEHRTFHAICGRMSVPCDFFGDIDLPLTTSTASIETMILTALRRVQEEVSAATLRQHPSWSVGPSSSSKGKGDAPPEVLLVTNPQATTKRSYHLHIRFPHVCFCDYRTVRHVAEKINGELGASFFDLACYRERGMMRTAYSRKVGVGSSSSLHHELAPAFPQISNSELKKLLEPSTRWSPAECVARSFVIREDFMESKFLKQTSSSATSFSSSSSPPVSLLEDDNVALAKALLPKTLSIPSFHEGVTAAERNKAAKQNGGDINNHNNAVTEYDKQGRPIPAFFMERVKPKRFREALKSVHALPSTAAEPYDQWIRVGLALHNFGSEDRNFEEWVQFSVRAPHKFSRETCRSMWDKFQRHPDHQNWARGYNYLTKSIWRELGIANAQ
ncbi:primase-like protein, putative [Bodo saltans]|uniref:Primase-like protein, putative n=1 Tax=Bodo saltans TaxID=75058 RepID=A0A0S4J9Z2_BODSA|nr:primase-like protein, putative [Bodo saltans]|eukprot:CUG87050.1 primase-like protein, putative [Bodo saltans]